MTRALDRLRGKHLGIVAVVLLVLLVLVVAHSLVMGGGHSDEMACGSCVVVIAAGLVAVMTLRPIRSVSVATDHRVRSTRLCIVPAVPVRPPPLRTTVLRL